MPRLLRPPSRTSAQWASSTGHDPAALEEALRLDARSAREFSPNKHPTRRPIFAEAPAYDPISGPTLSWGRKSDLVTSVSVPGQHLDPLYYQANLARAMRVLATRRETDCRRTCLGGLRH